MKFAQEVVESIWRALLWARRTLRGIARTMMPTLPGIVHELVALALLFFTILLVVDFLHDYAAGN